MALNLFGKPKRRSRSSGMGKGVETVMTIAAVGALGVGAYVVLSSGKGFREAQDTVGRGLKNAVDALDSTFEFLGSGSYKVQRYIGGGGGSSGGEEKDIVEKLADSVTGKAKGYGKWYTDKIAKEIQDNEDRSLINRKGIGDFFNNLGCGTILRPKC